MTARDAIATRLLRWFDANQRNLPWRRTREPWAIWVSEVMLQQTRVEVVREPWARFLRRYPDPAAFAAASDDDLLLAWRGLGYYRRARLLRDGARAVVARHAGTVPDDVEALAALPGIGPYTLGAIASIAFGRPLTAVDGNVERVVTRHRGITAPLGTSATRRAIRAAVAGWLDPRRPGDFNQSLMELGATICTPLSPACTSCPIGADCVALATGAAAALPVRKPPRAPVSVEARVALALRGGMALGRRVPDGQPNAGQIDLPGAGPLVSTAAAELGKVVRGTFGAELVIGAVVARVRHAITHHRITLHAHAAAVRRAGQLQWFPLDPDTPWTTAARKVFAQAVGTGGGLEA